MKIKPFCIGFLFLLCHTVSSASAEIRQLRSALAREQQAIVRLEQAREMQNKQRHQLQQMLAAQIFAAAKLTAGHNRKNLLEYHTRLARSQIKLIDDIRSAETANTVLLNQRILHQNTLKKLLLLEMKKTRIRSPSPPLPIATGLDDRQNNTAIRAIARGKVIFAEWLRGFGLMIIISHDNGYMSLYGQNSALYAKTGDNVSKGQLIALANNKKGKTPAERYFELRHNGTPSPQHKIRLY